MLLWETSCHNLLTAQDSRKSFLNLFWIGGKLLYIVVFVSAIQQGESAISMHTPPPSWNFLPPLPHSIPLGHHWAELPVLWSNFPLAIYSTYGNVYIPMLRSQFVQPSLSPLCPQVHSLCLHFMPILQTGSSVPFFLEFLTVETGKKLCSWLQS